MTTSLNLPVVVDLAPTTKQKICNNRSDANGAIPESQIQGQMCMRGKLLALVPLPCLPGFLMFCISCGSPSALFSWIIAPDAS